MVNLEYSYTVYYIFCIKYTKILLNFSINYNPILTKVNCLTT